ncbi:MAG: DUF1949 domain-containing protein [Firmicutes bacterium]|nr:DUF1949 domain-containing protein [Bacillota bacterium]
MKQDHVYRYRTIAAGVRTKIAVGACRFYASLSFCRTEEEARAFISGVPAELPGATHHAHAYRVGVGAELLARCDDAREPAGTAGPPLLSVLEKEQLTNVVVVGTRYFGGVKLGIGGLIRAYRACAEAGVEAATICVRELMARAVLQVPYDYLGAVVKEIEAAAGKVLNFHYGQDVTLECKVPLRKMEELPGRIAAAGRGRAVLKTVDRGF